MKIPSDLPPLPANVGFAILSRAATDPDGTVWIELWARRAKDMLPEYEDATLLARFRFKALATVPVDVFRSFARGWFLCLVAEFFGDQAANRLLAKESEKEWMEIVFDGLTMQ